MWARLIIVDIIIDVQRSHVVKDTYHKPSFVSFCCPHDEPSNFMIEWTHTSRGDSTIPSWALESNSEKTNEHNVTLTSKKRRLHQLRSMNQRMPTSMSRANNSLTTRLKVWNLYSPKWQNNPNNNNIYSSSITCMIHLPWVQIIVISKDFFNGLDVFDGN